MCSAFRQRGRRHRRLGARRERRVDPFGGTTLAQWRVGLGGRFAAQLAANPAYHQIRVIVPPTVAERIVRAGRMVPGNIVRIAPEAELQPRGDRDYFQRAMRLRAGEVDISPVELDREHGAIDAPHVPVVRASTPVVGPDGRPFGIVVIDIDLRGPFRARARERPPRWRSLTSSTPAAIIWSIPIRLASSASSSARRRACRTIFPRWPACWPVAKRAAGG